MSILIDLQEERLDTATVEKSRLFDLLSAEKEEKREIQEEKRTLIPPVAERKPKPPLRNLSKKLVLTLLILWSELPLALQSRLHPDSLAT